MITEYIPSRVSRDIKAVEILDVRQFVAWFSWLICANVAFKIKLYEK